MRAVLDTNVLISALFYPGGPPHKILEAVLAGEFRNATSPDLLTELTRILRGKFHLDEDDAERTISLISRNSELVYPVARINIIREDEADNRVLECAVTAKADRIVTGDRKHLIPLKIYQGISILSPSDFIHEVGLV